MPDESEPSQYMTVGEARAYLGVSKRKMTQLIESGVLPSEENPLDRRTKSIKRSAVEQLKRSTPEPRAAKSAA